MHYFLNKNIGTQLTGIEHAALARLKIFKNKKLPTKILTVAYNPVLANNLKLINLTLDDTTNLYHFFQNARAIPAYSLDDLMASGYFRIQKLDNLDDYRVYNKSDNTYLMYVNCFKNSRNIFYINFFDEQPKKIKRKIFDALGFLSKEIFLTSDLSIQFEMIYTVDGKKAIELYYKKENEKNIISHIILYYKDKTLSFKNENDLIEFWLNEIIKIQKSQTYFYIDRNLFFNPIIKNINSNQLKKISIIHSLHVSSLNDINTANILKGYKPPIEEHQSYDGVVVSTTSQKIDINKRFPENDNIFVIQPTYCSNEKTVTKVEKNEADVFKIISLGRYFSEKRLDHMLKAINIIKVKNPNIVLDLYGFPDSRNGQKTFKELKAFVKEQQLESNIDFKGYRNDIKTKLPEYDLALVTSSLEGFCIAILDTMNHAIPNIAYDIKYGPSELIDSDKNGYLVENSNIEMLAEYINNLIQDKEKLLNFSNAAFEKSLNYTIDQMGNKWLKLIEAI